MSVLPSSRNGLGPVACQTGRPARGARKVRVAENAAMNMPIFVAEYPSESSIKNGATKSMPPL